jgi:hypothetical protein
MAQMDNPLLAIGPARPGPALRPEFLVAIPVGVALFLEFGLDSPTKGAIAVVGAAAGYCFSVSPRLSMAGLSITLSMVIAQGLPRRAPGCAATSRWSRSTPVLRAVGTAVRLIVASLLS